MKKTLLFLIAASLAGCFSPAEKTKTGAGCFDHSQCESGFCIDWGGGFLCSELIPCAAGADCGSTPVKLACENVAGKGFFCVPEGQGNACIPKCEGRECGDNGCGGDCGTCPVEKPACNTVTGRCGTECAPDCGNRECGDNGCGGDCGTCPQDRPACDTATGRCGTECAPECGGRECGDNGCGGDCGSCGQGFTCDDNTGKCEPDTGPDPCDGVDCGNGTCKSDEGTAACECEDGFHQEGEGTRCVSNRKMCVIECSTASDCCYSQPCNTQSYGGWRCVEGRCRSIPCTSNEECVAFYSYVENGGRYICTDDILNDGNRLDFKICVASCETDEQCCPTSQNCATGAYPGWICRNNRCSIAPCLSTSECRDYYAGLQVANSAAYICTDDYNNDGEGELTADMCIVDCAQASDCCAAADPTYCRMPDGRDIFECYNGRCVIPECLSDDQCRQQYAAYPNGSRFVCSAIF